MGLGLASPRPRAASSKARAMNSESRERSSACASVVLLAPTFTSAVSRGIADSIEKGIDERLRVKGHKVVGGLAGSHERHRQTQFAHDRNDDAPARSAIELGEHDAGYAGDIGEFARLREAVLSRGGVEHEQHVVRRAGNK